MQKIFLWFTACLVLSSVLLAWDYECEGENIKLKLSSISGDKCTLKFNGREIHVVNVAKEQREQEWVLWGYLNDTKYRTYTFSIKDEEEDNFVTHVELEGDEHNDKAKITCQKIN